MRYTDRTQQLKVILKLLKDGDILTLKEIAAHVGIPCPECSMIMGNHRALFVMMKRQKVRKGRGSPSVFVYEISSKGRKRLDQLLKGKPPTSSSRGSQAVPPRAMPRNLIYLYSTVFRPYIELGNTGRQFTKQRHNGEVQG